MEKNPKTKLKIIEDILERTSAFHVNDDNPIDRDMLSDMIDDVRMKLIQDEFKATGTIDPLYYQMQCCIEILCADMAVCAVAGITFSSKEVINYVDASNVVPGLGNQAIKVLGFPDKNLGRSIYVGTIDAFRNITSLPYGKSEMIGAIVGDKLLLRNLPVNGSQFLCMTAVLSRPESACDYSSNSFYPVSNIDRLEYIVWLRVMQALAVPPDQINDASDVLKLQPKTSMPQDDGNG